MMSILFILLFQHARAQYFCSPTDVCNARLVADLTPGWNVKQYAIDTDGLDSFQREFTQTTLDPISGVSNYKLLFEGYIKITTGGSYTFTATADDNSYALIDGVHSFTKASSSQTFSLVAGYHYVQIQFQQGGGGQWQRVEYSGPDTGGTIASIQGQGYRYTGSQPLDICQKTCSEIQASPNTYLGCSSLGNCFVPSAAQQTNNWCTAKNECRKYQNGQWILESATCENLCGNIFSGTLETSGCSQSDCGANDCSAHPPSMINNFEDIVATQTGWHTIELSKIQVNDQNSKSCKAIKCKVVSQAGSAFGDIGNTIQVSTNVAPPKSKYYSKVTIGCYFGFTIPVLKSSPLLFNQVYKTTKGQTLKFSTCSQEMLDQTINFQYPSESTFRTHRCFPTQATSNKFILYEASASQGTYPDAYALNSLGQKIICSYWTPFLYISETQDRYTQHSFGSLQTIQVDSSNRYYVGSSTTNELQRNQHMSFYLIPKLQNKEAQQEKVPANGKALKISNLVDFSDSFVTKYQNTAEFTLGQISEADGLVLEFSHSDVVGNCGTLSNLEIQETDFYFDSSKQQQCQPGSSTTDCRKVLIKKAENKGQYQFRIIFSVLDSYTGLTQTQTLPHGSGEYFKVSLKCGQEKILAANSKFEYLYQLGALQTVSLLGLFQTKFNQCIKEFQLFQEADATNVLVHDKLKVNGNNLEVTTDMMMEKTLFVKAVPSIDDKDHWAVVEVKVTVCGNEQVNIKDSGPYQVSLDSWEDSWTNGIDIQPGAFVFLNKCHISQVELRQFGDKAQAFSHPGISLTSQSYSTSILKVIPANIGAIRVQFYIRYQTSPSSKDGFKEIIINAHKVRDNCLGSPLMQFVNFPDQPLYKLEESSNTLAQDLRSLNLSVLHEPIHYVFEEFLVQDSSKRNDPSCSTTEYSLKLFYFENQVYDGSNLDSIEPVQVQDPFVTILKNSVRPSELNVQGTFDQNKRYNKLSFFMGNGQLKNMTYLLQIDAIQKYGDDLPLRLVDQEPKKTLKTQIEVGDCKPIRFLDTSDQKVALGNLTTIEYSMNKGQMVFQSPFDNIIATYPNCGAKYKIKQRIDFSFIANESEKIDPQILQSFVRFQNNPTGVSKFTLHTNNYNLMKLLEFRMILSVTKTDNPDKDYLQGSFNFFINSTVTRFEQNKPPEFEEDPPKLLLASNLFPMMSQKLPEITDPNSNDIVNLVIDGEDIDNYIKYDKETNALKFSRKTMSMTRDIPFRVILEDNSRISPGRTEYDIILKCTYCLQFFDIQEKAEEEEKLEVIQNKVKRKRVEDGQMNWKPPSIMIKAISNDGKLPIVFSEKMIFPEEWYTQAKGRRLSNDSIKDYIDIHIDPEDKTMENLLKLDYHIHEIEPQELKIQLTFENPDQVSMSDQSKPDKLRVSFKEAFLDSIKGKFSRRRVSFEKYNENTKILKRLPAQLQLTNTTQAILDTQENSVVGLQSFVWLNFLLSFFISYSLNQIWSMVNCLQMIVFLVLLNLTFPANLNSLMTVLINVATFDMVPMIDEFNEWFYSFNHTSEVLEMSSIGYEQLELETRNFTVNCGSMFYLALLFVMNWVCLKLVSFFLTQKETACCVRLLRKLQFQSYLREIIIRFLIEGYIEFLISALISFELFVKVGPIFGNISDILAFVSSQIFLVLLAGLPLYLIIIIQKKYYLLSEYQNYPLGVDKKIINEQKLQLKKLDLYYGFLFTDFKKRTDVTIYDLSYYYFYILRRLIFVMTAFYLQDYPAIQIMILNYLTMTIQIYVVGAQPFTYRQQNRMEIFNESIIICVNYGLFYITDWMPSPNLKSAAGLYIIGCICTIIGVNLSVISYNLFTNFKQRRRQKKYQTRLEEYKRNLNEKFTRPYEKKWMLQAIEEKRDYAQVVQDMKVKRMLFMMKHVPGYEDKPKKNVRIIIEDVDRDNDGKLEWYKKERMRLIVQEEIERRRQNQIFAESFKSEIDDKRYLDYQLNRIRRKRKQQYIQDSDKYKH